MVADDLDVALGHPLTLPLRARGVVAALPWLELRVSRLFPWHQLEGAHATVLAVEVPLPSLLVLDVAALATGDLVRSRVNDLFWRLKQTHNLNY